MFTLFLVRTLLTLSAINKCHSRQVELIMAYPQDPIEYDIFVELTKVFNTKEGYGQTHVLHFLKKLYCQKQDGRIWNHYIYDVLKSIGFKQSAVYECAWYWYNTISFYFFGGGIFMGPYSKSIDKAIKEIKKEGLNI